MARRPKYLNLLQIRQPVPAVVSILHRISGFILFLALPLLLFWLQRSLASEEGFASLEEILTHPIAKIVIIGLIWGYLHHLLAGVRHLALDLDVGTDLAPARLTSYAVLIIAIALTVIFAVWLW
jgi:succinate dehydrogenase / fumarate reductase cytochrome b subunit